MAAAEENKCDDSLPELPKEDKEVLDALMKGSFDKDGGWSEKATWEEKDLNVKGRIISKTLGDDPCLWCRSVTEFSGPISKKEIADKYWNNLELYAVNKADIKEAKAKKNDKGEIEIIYLTFPMPLMISNRDLCATIKNYKYGDKIVTVWAPTEHDDFKVPKKWVRMTINSYSFSEFSDGLYKTIDFDKVDMGGSLPSKIVNMMVGNKADYIQMAKDLKTISEAKE